VQAELLSAYVLIVDRPPAVLYREEEEEQKATNHMRNEVKQVLEFLRIYFLATCVQCLLLTVCESLDAFWLLNPLRTFP
jgi:hypothetical protein